MKNYYVYIITNKRNGTLYTGVTSNLVKRVWQHKSEEVAGFSKRYKLKTLVYYEIHTEILEAIKREKNIKAWNRKWKLELIEHTNPSWKDLYDGLIWGF